MKMTLLLTAVVLSFSGCASRNGNSNVHSDRVLPAPTHIVRSVLAEGQQNVFGRRIFEVGQQRFTTMAEFQAFIARLPPGSIVAWDSGCIRYQTIPLLDTDMTIDAFKEYCRERGVEFRFICGY